MKPIAFTAVSIGRVFASSSAQAGPILAAAGVERCRLHDCRHAFASMLLNEGASLYQVQLLLGHASRITTQRYAHLASSTQRITSQLVSNLVNKS
jgi:site-specific recombinase XerD